jgi:Oligoketide cyclase/lipid transport protein
MPEYEQTGTIMADADTLFEYLSDIERLPEYLPVITEAEQPGPDVATVTTDIHGTEQHAQGWVRIDGLDRRMEWGTPGSAYHGWLQVEPDDTGDGSVLTIHVVQDHPSDADDDLLEAIENIRQLADAGEI